MERIILLFLAVAFSCMSHAENRVITAVIDGSESCLDEYLGADAMLADSMCIYGCYIKDSDFKRLREYVTDGCLRGLDISVAGLEFEDRGLPDHAFDFGDFKPSEGHPGLACVTLPKDTRRIGSHAFRNTQMESIEIPRTVSLIGDSAFEACRNLRDIYIRCTTPPAASGAFVMETLPQDMTLHVPAGTSDLYRSAGGWSIFGNIVEDSRCFVTLEAELDGTRTLGEALAESGLQPDSLSVSGMLSADDFETMKRELSWGRLTGIDLAKAHAEGNRLPDDAFGYAMFSKAYVRQMMHVSLPEDLEVIGKYAFRNAMIKEIELPGTVREIAKEAFFMSDLEGELVLPEGVETLGRDCFGDCSFLASIRMPSTLRRVEEMAFFMWQFRKPETFSGYSIHVNSKTPPRCSFSNEAEEDDDFGMFFEHAGMGKAWMEASTVYVPVGCAQDYRQSYDWCIFGNIVEAEWLDGGTDDISVPFDGSTFEDDTVTVLTTDGRVVYEGKVMPQLERGLYIVRMGGKTVKMAR